MSLDSLKINKQLKLAMNSLGIHSPTKIQEKTINRIIGGHDVVATGPEGCGKTTAAIMGVIARLVYAQGDAPRALYLVPTQEKVEEIEELFAQLGVNTDLRVETIKKNSNFDYLRDLLAEGVDIVIGTPERTQPFYYKTGINVTQLKMLVIDGADHICRIGTHTSTKQLAENIPVKSQHLVFSQVIHPKVENMMEDFLNFPNYIEVKEQKDLDIETIDLKLYEVQNFKTKLNLINILLGDAVSYPKSVVFSSSKLNAAKIYKSLEKRNPDQIVLLNPSFFDQKGVTSVEEFQGNDNLRTLVISTEDLEQTLNLGNIPHIIHFDLGDDKDQIINRIVRFENSLEDAQAIFFATENEIAIIRRIEQSLDMVIPVEDLPIGTVVEGDVERVEVIEGPILSDDPNVGAFHKKKEKNSKTYNYGIKDKVEKFGKYRKKGNKK